MTAATAPRHSRSPDDAPTRARARRPAPVARFRVRVMSGSTIAVGPGKIELLEAIDKTRSITAAAKAMGMSYRRAWMLVDEINAAMKEPAVASAKGGEHGGGSRLTAVGEALVAAYRRIELRAAETCADDISDILSLVR